MSKVYPNSKLREMSGSESITKSEVWYFTLFEISSRMLRLIPSFKFQENLKRSCYFVPKTRPIHKLHGVYGLNNRRSILKSLIMGSQLRKLSYLMSSWTHLQSLHLTSCLQLFKIKRTFKKMKICFRYEFLYVDLVYFGSKYNLTTQADLLRLICHSISIQRGNV